MSQKVLITGGAGFIGSHLADELISRGHEVRVIDVLHPQVHGPFALRPSYLSPEVELMIGDLRDRDAVRRALGGVDTVFHLAAAVGVGQSMYQIAEYTSANNLGTAVLLETMAEASVGRFVVASSMSVYGEGLYRTADGARVLAEERTLEQLRSGHWEPEGPRGERLTPLPTPEHKTPSLSSVYALSKFDQEQLCLMMGRAYRIPTTALRFFNVYGPRQALSNPYTGVLAIFAARLLNGKPPLIFEDGLQRRDFVNVHDVARACRMVMETNRATGRVINIGSGQSVTIREVAEQLASVMGREDLGAMVTSKYRMGDIRHCFADTTLARELLGFEPKVSFREGLRELSHWLEGQHAEDRVAQARAELDARGLTL